MRMLEIKTASNAHKVTVLYEQAVEGMAFTLTLMEPLEKLRGVVINNMVAVVNHLADGTAKSDVSDVSSKVTQGCNCFRLT